MSTFNYYQREGGNEEWHIIPTADAQKLTEAMFTTVLSVDVPIRKDMTREEYADVKYNGPLYFDLDDEESPASTAKDVMQLLEKLQDKGDVPPEFCKLYATGGKGFHILVPQETFLDRVPPKGFTFLPAIYKEMAYEFAVESMDFRVYSARMGRMFRNPNVKRPNGKYKVQLTLDEVRQIAEADDDTAAALYGSFCSSPRDLWETATPSRCVQIYAMFTSKRDLVVKRSRQAAKVKPVTLPDNLPSFDALLRGEGVKSDVGFHQIAMQVAITAHARGIGREELVGMAEGLCEKHQSDGYRYDTTGKRRLEIARMWDYTEGNPCYAYSAPAIASLLSHSALDLKGVEITEEEARAAMEEGENPSNEGEFDHAGVNLTASGAYVDTEKGPKRVMTMAFHNVSELLSADSGEVANIEADIVVGERKLGRKSFTLETFSSTASLNKAVMPLGQTFSGTDIQARGMYLRILERARRQGRQMYVTQREGMDMLQLPFHQDSRLHNPFLVWSDQKGVQPERRVSDTGVQLKFQGYPLPQGEYQSDLSQSQSLRNVKENDFSRLQSTIDAIMACQTPGTMGKLLGWMTACHYRMVFHTLYGQFPILHVNGAAGNGKTQMVKLFSNLHYYKQEPKMLTPSSTVFAVKQVASLSASIPLILDEFKPAEMQTTQYDSFKLMLRDAYNCRAVERGGGNRDSSDYRAIHRTMLSAPICFIAEAAENETAIMERVILLTLVKPASVRANDMFNNYSYVLQNKDLLGVMGLALAKSILKSEDILSEVRESFDEIYMAARKELMLQQEDLDVLAPEEIRRKASAKERTVFNYSVARFGLNKFQELCEYIAPGRWTADFEAMQEDLYSTIGDLQEQTVPEWLKVLNQFAYMHRADNHSLYYLRLKHDFNIGRYEGKDALFLDARGCYAKYRMYSMATSTKPLFPTEQAFAHALNNLSSCLGKNVRGNSYLNAPGGVHILDLEELRRLGFIDIQAK